MTNSNSADISVFEGLQASANASMGVGSTSQMSVFNSPQDVAEARKAIVDVQKGNTLLKELKKQLTDIQKEKDVLAQKSSSVMSTYSKVEADVSRTIDLAYKKIDAAKADVAKAITEMSSDERESRKGKKWEESQKMSKEVDALCTFASSAGLYP